MAQSKTTSAEDSVEAFLRRSPERRQEDTRRIISIMRKATRQPPQMWGASMIGFGHYFYRYDSGREGLGCLTAVSPRKANLVVYIMPGFDPFASKMKQLGKYKTGKCCLYLNRLDDVDIDLLAEMIGDSVRIMKERYLTGARARKAAEGG